jgi:hypothetical protein
MNPRTKLRFFLFTFALVWSALTCAFLAFTLSVLFNQYRTLSFHPVRATIDSIERTTSASGHDTTHGIDIAYHYNIAHHRYNSTRLRFGKMSSSDNWASDMLQQFPVRSHPTAYVNPNDPTDSVLLRGPDGLDFFLLLFLTPFTMAMLGLWTGIIVLFLPKSAPRHFNIYENGPITRFRPTRLLPFIAFIATLGLSAFISIFIIGFSSNDMHNSLHAVQIAAVISLALAPLAALLAFLLRAAGTFDITFDESQQLLTTRTLRIPAAHFTDLYISSNPGRNNGSPTFDIILHYTQNNIPETLLLKRSLLDPDTAARLALYLSLRLNLPALTGNNLPVLPPAPAP